MQKLTKSTHDSKSRNTATSGEKPASATKCEGEIDAVVAVSAKLSLRLNSFTNENNQIK